MYTLRARCNTRHVLNGYHVPAFWREPTLPIKTGVGVGCVGVGCGVCGCGCVGVWGVWVWVWGWVRGCRFCYDIHSKYPLRCRLCNAREMGKTSESFSIINIQKHLALTLKRNHKPITLKHVLRSGETLRPPPPPHHFSCSATLHMAYIKHQPYLPPPSPRFHVPQLYTWPI